MLTSDDLAIDLMIIESIRRWNDRAAAITR